MYVFTNLSQCCCTVHHREERSLLTGSDVQVHYFMGECGELVAEADLVGAPHGSGVREAVILLLSLMIQDVVQWICHKAVHVIVPTCNHLETHKNVCVCVCVISDDTV